MSTCAHGRIMSMLMKPSRACVLLRQDLLEHYRKQHQLLLNHSRLHQLALPLLREVLLQGRLDYLLEDDGDLDEQEDDTRALVIHLVPFLLKDNSFKQVHNSKELDCPGDKCKLGRDHNIKTTYKVLRTADSQSGAASFSFRTSFCMSSEMLRKSITLSMISPYDRRS